MKRALIAAAAALTLTACETATPYQPAAVVSGHVSYNGGYTEQQLEDNRWKVEFAGNSLTSRQTVERYLLYRAAQLTLAQGNDWFQTVDRHTSRQTETYGFADPGFEGYGNPFWGFYGGAYPGRYGAFGDPFFGGGYGGFGGFDVDQDSRYTSVVEILLGHGPKPPNNPRAYDARSVVEHLQGTIAYPKTS